MDHYAVVLEAPLTGAGISGRDETNRRTSRQRRVLGSDILQGALDLLFPGRCGACPARVDDRASWCDACARATEALGRPRCTMCAVPFEGAGSDHPCGECLARPPRFAGVVAPYVYGGSVAAAVCALKYGGRTDLAVGLARSVAACLPEGRIDRVIPVPLHERRLAERGFNQAGLLAAAIAELAEARVDHDALVRRRETAPQAGLGRSARVRNVRGAFSVRPGRRASLEGERVVLVDDVVTTTETVRACASALRRAGVREVWVAAVARAMW
jgi:ComF family protein